MQSVRDKRLKLLSKQAFLQFLGRLMSQKKNTVSYHSMNDKPLKMVRFVLIDDRSSQGKIQIYVKRSPG